MQIDELYHLKKYRNKKREKGKTKNRSGVLGYDLTKLKNIYNF